MYSPNNSSTSSNISCSDDICKDALKTGHSVCQASDTPSNQCGYSQAYADGTIMEGYYVSHVMRFDTVMENKNESATVSSASVIFGYIPLCVMHPINSLRPNELWETYHS